MKYDVFILAAIIAGSSFAGDLPDRSGLMQNPGRTPLAFTRNMGQWDERVLFRADAIGATIWFTRESVTYQFIRHFGKGTSGESGVVNVRDSSDAIGFHPSVPVEQAWRDKDSAGQMLITAKFRNASPDAVMVAEGRMDYTCNYFRGNDASEWYTDVPNYAAITIRNVYDGVDLCFSGDADGRLAYQYAIAPGAVLNDGGLVYDGVERTWYDSDGVMMADTKWGTVAGLLALPADGTNPVFGKVSLTIKSARTAGGGGDTHGFTGLDGSTPISSTFLGGGTGSEGAFDIAVDSSGCVYVTGFTWSTDFPTVNPFDNSYNGGDPDVFVTKFSATGNSLVYSTYLGGSNSEEGQSIAIDDSGCAYVTGFTQSPNFPTQNAYDAGFNGTVDAFVTKFSETGDALVYSTYLGGTNTDRGWGITVDGSGSAYIAGWTRSPNFPTQNAYDAIYSDYDDVFVTKFSAAGNTLIYSTFLGGSDDERCLDIAADRFGCVYITGWTRSANFPVLNAYDAGHNGYDDVFVTKFSAGGDTLIYSTFVGGSAAEESKAIAVDHSGCAYVTGLTRSSDFPTQNAYDAGFEGYNDAFVTKLSAGGNALVYSTFLGGSSDEEGWGIVVDDSGCAFITGYTFSADFPTHNAYDGSYNGFYDAFVTGFSVAGDTLIFSTFLGGADWDYGWAIAMDATGCIYVSGDTNSPDFPAINGYDDSINGYDDVFVTRLCGLVVDVNDFDEGTAIPHDFGLAQNYPNPFNPLTRIDFTVAKRGHVAILIHNLLGQEIVTLVDETRPVGRYSVVWDGRDSFGRRVASGIYLYSLQTDDMLESRKMILLK